MVKYRILIFTISLFIFSCSIIGTIDNVNISEYFPERLEFCGIVIDSTSTEYKELQTWFNNNKENWQLSPVSYIVGTEFRSDLLHINILEDFVVVNFRDKDNKWKQITHFKEKKDLNFICNQKE